jgi:hypothetical protein
VLEVVVDETLNQVREGDLTLFLGIEIDGRTPALLTYESIISQARVRFCHALHGTV